MENRQDDCLLAWRRTRVGEAICQDSCLLDGDAGVIRVDDNGELVNDDVQYANYHDRKIQLGDHHTISAKCGLVKINVKTAML